MPSQVKQLQSLLKRLANTESIEEITLGNCLKSVSVEERYKSLQNVRGDGLRGESWTALQGAAGRGYKQLVRALLGGLTPEQNYEILKIQDSGGITALHCAAYVGQTDTARVLLGNLTQEHRLTLLKIQTSEGSTALHYAAYYGHTDTARVLLDMLIPAHRLTLLDMQDEVGRTARDVAIQWNHPEYGACLQKIRAEAEEAINRVSRDQRNNLPQSGVTEEDIAGVLRVVEELGARVEGLETVCVQQDKKIREQSLQIVERDGKVEELETAVVEAEQRLGTEVEKLKVQIGEQDGKIKDRDANVQQLEAEQNRMKEELKDAKEEVAFLSIAARQPREDSV